MKRRTIRSARLNRGMALMSAMLLLLVMTILGIAMFRSFGMQERIAGNTREKQRANYSADSAEAYAEWWLASQGGINATAGVTCGALVSADGATPTTQVCSNILSTVVADPSVVPWLNGGVETGVTYTPSGITTAAGSDSYFQIPRFYISYVSGKYNATTGAATNSYLIDATGYGGTGNAVSVVESSFVVSKLYTTKSTRDKFTPLDKQ